jgi:hypothetical protein
MAVFGPQLFAKGATSHNISCVHPATPHLVGTQRIRRRSWLDFSATNGLLRERRNPPPRNHLSAAAGMYHKKKLRFVNDAT